MPRPSAVPALQAGLLGLVTGARSMTGLAAYALVTPTSVSSSQPERVLGHRWVRTGLVLAAVAEVVADKLPGTGSRLQPPALAGRLVVAAALGVLVARQGAATMAPSTWVTTVPTAVLASLGWSVLGSRWRAWASRRLGPDLPGAVLEDVAAGTLAWTATRG